MHGKQLRHWPSCSSYNCNGAEDWEAADSAADWAAALKRRQIVRQRIRRQRSGRRRIGRQWIEQRRIERRRSGQPQNGRARSNSQMPENCRAADCVAPDCTSEWVAAFNSGGLRDDRLGGDGLGDGGWGGGGSGDNGLDGTKWRRIGRRRSIRLSLGLSACLLASLSICLTPTHLSLSPSTATGLSPLQVHNKKLNSSVICYDYTRICKSKYSAITRATAAPYSHGCNEHT